jgi:hypothetical protein
LPSPFDVVALLDGVRDQVLHGREAVARAVNVALVLLYRQIGRRIRCELPRTSVPATANRLSRHRRDN